MALAGDGVSRCLENVRTVVTASHGLDHQSVEQLGVVDLLLQLGHGTGAGANVVHGSTRCLGRCGGCASSLVLVGLFEEVHCWSLCFCIVRVRVRLVEVEVCSVCWQQSEVERRATGSYLYGAGH